MSCLRLKLKFLPVLILSLFIFISGCSFKKEAPVKDDSPPLNPPKTNKARDNSKLKGSEVGPNGAGKYGIDTEIYEMKKRYLPEELKNRKGPPDYYLENEAFKRLRNEQPENGELYFLIGLNNFHMGNLDDAIEELRRCLEIQPDNPKAFELLALSYYKAEKFVDAKQVCLLGLEKYSDVPIFYSILGSIYHHGDYDLNRAVEYHQKAVDMDPNDPGFRLKLAEAYLENRDQEGKNADKGIAILEEMVDKFPTYHLAQILLAEELFLNRGDCDRSIKLLLKAKDIAPDYFQTYQTLGEIYLTLGKYDKAQKYLMETLKHNPEYISDVYVRMGQLEYGVGNLDKARKWFEKAKEEFNSEHEEDTSKKAADANFGLARMSWEAGNYDEAYGYLLKAKEWYPHHEDLYYYFTLFYLAKGDVKNAEESAEKTYVPDRDASTLDKYMRDYLWAMINARKGNRKKAVQLLEEAIMRDPIDFCYRDQESNSNFKKIRDDSIYKKMISRVEDKKGLPLKYQ